MCVAGILHKGQRRQALFEESVALSRSLGDERGLTFTLSWLGHHLRTSGLDYTGGTARLAAGLRLAREVGDGRLIAEALWLEAMSADLSQAEERARALTAAEESLALFQVAGDQTGITLAQRSLGWAACAQGDYERARAAFAAALTVMRSLADRGGIVQGLAGLAAVARAQGDLAGAAALYRESLAQRRVLHSSWNEGDILDGLAALAVARGQPVRAARLLGATEALREAIATRLLPLERAGHEATVRATRAALGDDAFAAAWAAGQALAPDEIVAEALAEEADRG